MTPESRLLQLSHAARYAVSAVAYLASARDAGYRMTEDVAVATRLPASYLAKILQRLARRGLLDSRPGVKGGYRLAVPPTDLVLSEVIAAAREADDTFMPCMLEARACDGRKPCAMHLVVAATERMLWSELENTSFAGFVKPRGAGRRPVSRR